MYVIRPRLRHRCVQIREIWRHFVNITRHNHRSVQDSRRGMERFPPQGASFSKTSVHAHCKGFL